MRRRSPFTALAAGLLFAAVSVPAVATAAPATPAATGELTSYLVVFDTGVSGTVARQMVTAAGGTIASDLTDQIGVVVATSAVPGFDATLRASGLVEDAAENLRFQGLPATQSHPGDGVPGGGAEPSNDALESLQWDMAQIRTEEAHAIQAGSPAVDVGILDSGIDGSHADFNDVALASNVDCSRGRNFVTFLPTGPGVGTPDPCTDNQFHGTHVAGTVAARANGAGIVGVAPNVTLVPVKVCDASGYCYADAVVEGITYAGDAQLDVINMSFFVDDNEFQESTEFKCNSHPVMRTFRRAVERAVSYARSQGVTPIAALGNSDQDLAHPVDENGEPISNECEVVPAETQGVIGVTSLGPTSEKAAYSNYGTGQADVAAPGGNGETGDCATTILSTIPGAYVCIQGTSMASPHAAGVAALIVSQYGTVGRDGDVKMSPQQVEAYLQGTTVDIGLPGYDECFGHGRIDALRAVTHDTSRLSEATEPCPEYSE
jgi:lantibiotic leader peptide-processing serine protease